MIFFMNIQTLPVTHAASAAKYNEIEANQNEIRFTSKLSELLSDGPLQMPLGVLKSQLDLGQGTKIGQWNKNAPENKKSAPKWAAREALVNWRFQFLWLESVLYMYRYIM
jgi:hypothetical protein